MELAKIAHYEERWNEQLRTCTEVESIKEKKLNEFLDLMAKVSKPDSGDYYCEAFDAVIKSRRIIAWTFPY